MNKCPNRKPPQLVVTKLVLFVGGMGVSYLSKKLLCYKHTMVCMGATRTGMEKIPTLFNYRPQSARRYEQRR